MTIRIPDLVLSQLQSYLDQQGLTVTEGILAAIASYVGDNERLPLVEWMSWGGQRLAQLEGKS